MGIQVKWNDERVGGLKGGVIGAVGIAVAIVVGIAVAGAVALALGWVVSLLWNWLMPSIFGLGAITYWQGVGLLVLAHILLKSHHDGHSRHDRKKDKKRGKDEDREELARDVAARVKAMLDAEKAAGSGGAIPAPEPPQPA